MSEDYKDKIQEIRSRRNNNYQAPASAGPSVPSYDPSPSVGRTTANQSIGTSQQVQTNESIFGPDFKSPWLRDRVTLSLEGQIAMMELRGVARTNSVDLGYTNRIPILPIRSGIFVKIEPPGTYKLCYHYR